MDQFMKEKFLAVKVMALAKEANDIGMVYTSKLLTDISMIMTIGDVAIQFVSENTKTIFNAAAESAAEVVLESLIKEEGAEKILNDLKAQTENDLPENLRDFFRKEYGIE